ncbi:MAG: glutamate-1-semialdehyde 2,1-aminomutase [bacterium]|nr:glutamate-1-semialdehyde 2,1-aminomutase [bacterium]
MGEISKKLFEEAKKYIPGGVNSPVRAFKSVGIDPLFIDRGKGSKIYDVDGKEYIDYVLSWGPLILGHAPAKINKALKEAMKKGTSFGAPTAYEIELAKLVTSAVPSCEMIRMVNSGTEATMSAIRVARGYTGRNKIIKFAGCYHGHADSLLVKAGSGATTFGVPDSPGVPGDVAKYTINLTYNNLGEVEDTIRRSGHEIACVIVEPIAGNMGVIPPVKGFLEGLRKLTQEYGIVLIFDEVMTGFRVSYGGAQELYGIKPDMTTLGKVIGGGLPVGAYGGKREIMEKVSPSGPIYQAGTLSGNPLAMAAGIEMLKILSNKNIYKKLERLGGKLSKGIEKAAGRAGVDIYTTRVGSMFCAFFTSGKVTNYEEAKRSDTNKFSLFFQEMLKRNIYLAPSQYEAVFLSNAHSTQDIDLTVRAAEEVFEIIKQKT